MFVYSVTVGVDKEIEQEWLVWMVNEHIPRVLDTGLFVDHKIFQVLTEEENNISYNIQYFAETLTHVETYLDRHAPRLIQEHQDKYRDRHVAFRTLLKEVK